MLLPPLEYPEGTNDRMPELMLCFATRKQVFTIYLVGGRISAKIIEKVPVPKNAVFSFQPFLRRSVMPLAMLVYAGI